MLTREEYEDRVSRPGKFEGAAPYAPYLWEESVLHGDFEDTRWGAKVRILREDWDLFPELKAYKWAFLWEDDNGFVYCTLSNKER